MGKPVGSRFLANDKKYSGLVISSQNRVYHLHKSVHYTDREKRLRKPEAGIKDGF